MLSVVGCYGLELGMPTEVSIVLEVVKCTVVQLLTSMCYFFIKYKVYADVLMKHKIGKLEKDICTHSVEYPI